MTRTGIFLCTCDQKISKGVDVERAARTLGGEGVVKLAEHVCLPNGIRSLQRDIIDNNLERVVVAACPRRYQEKRLQEACVEAGININRFGLVDWREGCAWAHRGDKEGATAQAIDLVRMGVARVERAQPLDGVLTRITPRILVIGGGIAGLTAARALADRGIAVTLVERDRELGGQLNGFPLNGQAETYETSRREVLHHNRIDVRLNSHVVAAHGTVGNYRIEVADPSRGDECELNVGAVVIATGAREHRDARLFRYDGRRVTTLEEFEKRIHHLAQGDSAFSPLGPHPSPHAIPNSLVYLLCAGSRDEHIPYCSNICCLGALNQAIRVKRANPTANVTILFRDLYLLGDELNEKVVREARRAGIEFVRYAPSTPPRVEEDFVIVRDEAGVARWLGYDLLVLATPQVPREDAGALANMFNLIRDQDGFFLDPHWRLRPEHRGDSGMFVCGSAHRPVDTDTAVMQGLTAAARAARFIQKRELMRPASSAWVDAQLCTGCAQCVSTCPVGAIEMKVGESIRTKPGQVQPGLTAFEHTKAGFATGSRGVLPPTLDRAVVDPFLCLACGNCAAACPTKAIDMPSASDAMIFAQIEAGLGGRVDRGNGKPVDMPRDPAPTPGCGALSGSETGRQGDTPRVPASPSPRVVVFGCQWSGAAAMELAGARGTKYPANVRVIELPCSARLDPMHVLYAFLNGAEVVVLALCPPDECHFGSGNRFAEARIENLRAVLASHGIDPLRLQVARMMGDDAAAWVKAVEGVAGRKAPGKGDRAHVGGF